MHPFYDKSIAQVNISSRKDFLPFEISYCARKATQGGFHQHPTLKIGRAQMWELCAADYAAQEIIWRP